MLSLDDLPLGSMQRVTHGDLDVLIAHTAAGLVATDDRCPHMSAPLSIGRLEECQVTCPLHQGRFDLSTGGVVRFPTTGGLDPDGIHHPTWAPPGAPPKPEPSDDKARARALTRVRSMRYYPLRVVGNTIEVALPE
jgi:naphthalene 1,2-dioxygenase system ferredoxin subunit